MQWLLILLFSPGFLFAESGLELAGFADDNPSFVAADTVPGYVARIDFEQSDQIDEALRRAEAYFQSTDYFESPQGPAEPIVFVIYGPDVAMFYQANYAAYKSIVDLAARLSSLGVIDVRVCQFSSKSIGSDRTGLLPFVSPVHFGPDELKRLLEEESYSFF